MPDAIGDLGASEGYADCMPWATARPEVEVSVPAGDGGYLAIVVFALEDAANDGTDPELAAHFVDDVCLVIGQSG